MIDYREQVAEQFKPSTRLNSILDTFAAVMEPAERMLSELRAIMDASHSEGVQLDRIGYWKGLPRRAAETDATYATRLQAAGGGLPSLPAIRRSVKDINSCDDVGLYPAWPAGLYVVVDDISSLLRDNVVSLSSVGVDIMLGTFLCDDDDPDSLIVDDDTEYPIVVDAD